MPSLRNLVRLSFFSSLGLGLFLIVGLIFSVPLQEHLVVHGQIQSLSSEYTVNGKADPQHILQFTIELNPGNMSGLEAELYAVSDPRSKKYGKHLTKNEVDSFVRPSPEVTTALNNWLDSHGITPESTSSSGHLLTVQIPVTKANSMFNTSLMSITHTQSNRTVVRAMEYSLPARLSNHTRSVRPILAASSVSSSGKRPITPQTGLRRRGDGFDNNPGQGCDKGITLGCIQKTYNIPSDVAIQGPVGKIGIFGRNTAVPVAVDIAKYLKIVRPGMDLAPIQVEMIANLPNNSTSAEDDIEATLDIQTLLGINPHFPLVVYINPNDVEEIAGGAEAMLDAFNFILANDDLPYILAMSYFISENSTDPAFVKAAKSVCDAITQLGARGISVLTNAAIAQAFPSTCPHATSVAPTRFDGGAEVVTGATGGFSTIFTRSSYQDSAVKGYLSKINSNQVTVQFNSSNRCSPDVASFGVDIWNVEKGNGLFSGLVDPAPHVWAAVIAYFNAQRQGQGKSPLGFLNPLLYTKPNAFNDIIQGDTFDFPVMSGWDPVTGLGSPNYELLSKIV